MATNDQPKSIEERLSIKTPTADGKVWHDAACHCHGVEYKILFAPIYPPYTGANTERPGGTQATDSSEGAPPLIIRCNCSICNKNGYTLIYPNREDVVFTKGYDTLKDYQFATRTRDHKFCPNCGSSIMIDFRGFFPERDSLGMNVGDGYQQLVI